MPSKVKTNQLESGGVSQWLNDKGSYVCKSLASKNLIDHNHKLKVPFKPW